jgi:hypothetical protein
MRKAPRSVFKWNAIQLSVGCSQCYSDINDFNDLSVRLVIWFWQIPMALFTRHKAAFVSQSGIDSLDEVASLGFRICQHPLN